VRRLHRFKTKVAVTEQLLRSALIDRHGSQSASWGEVGACWCNPPLVLYRQDRFPVSFFHPRRLMSPLLLSLKIASTEAASSNK
jgi:hypothetical protein